MEWISVKDRLPELFVEVLAYSLDENDIDEISVDFLYEWPTKEKFWDYLGNNVTHWMPLPEPPKK